MSDWKQLHGYYLTKANAASYAAHRNAASKRGDPQYRSKFRVRGKKVRQRTHVGTNDRGQTQWVEAGQSFYWVEESRG